MRYITTINNIRAVEWDLTLQLAYLFAWMYELPAWAEKLYLENEVYYYASRHKAIEELPILTDKADTMYRHYKSLAEKNLISIKKIDGKDWIALLPKGKLWNEYQSEYSEKNPNSYFVDKQPIKADSECNAGIISDNSEKNPTNNNIIYNNNYNIKKEKEKNNINLSLFEIEKEKPKKTMFRNSQAYDKKIFYDKLKNEDQLGIDLEYYYQAVSDWSDRNDGKKSTVRGWIATVRTFIRNDHDKNKVKFVNTNQANSKRDADAVDYLNI